jgi:hypothetical protein
MVIEGDLTQFFVEPFVTPITYTVEADIGLELEAHTQSGLAAKRRFYVKHSSTGLWATDSTFKND